MPATKTTPLPDEIGREMGAWREGLVPLPQSYIDFHRGLAEAAVEGLKPEYAIHRTYMSGDGWMDGMKVLFVIAERRATGVLVKLYWHDGNQGFFRVLPGNRGSIPFRGEDDAAV